MGAAGRDFHNFNTIFRDDPLSKVVCFTATQIPDIWGRRYPSVLAGKLYPRGIPIYQEEELPNLISKYKINDVVLSYSDLSYEDVMHKASLVLSTGANFVLLDSKSTMLKPKKPMIAVTAVRTGCGKSQVTHKVAEILKRNKKRPVVVRHPMPYGDLKKQACQRFAKFSDLEKHKCTIEEMEEYMPHLEKGTVVYAGVDYKKILSEAEKEADVVVFDGGNNDTPFFVPNLWIVIADPLRPGHEIRYYPGEINLRMADIAIINKESSAKKADITLVEKNIESYNPKAKIIHAESLVTVDSPRLIRGKRVLVIEDGPTLTHGGMGYGAGVVAAKRFRCKIIDPKKYAKGSLKSVYKKYTGLGPVLPAMGYSKKQIAELERTINAVPCDTVICATPVDLRKIIKITKPVVKISYMIKEKGKLHLNNMLKKFL